MSITVWIIYVYVYAYNMRVIQDKSALNELTTNMWAVFLLVLTLSLSVPVPAHSSVPGL